MEGLNQKFLLLILSGLSGSKQKAIGKQWFRRLSSSPLTNSRSGFINNNITPSSLIQFSNSFDSTNRSQHFCCCCCCLLIQWCCCTNEKNNNNNNPILHDNNKQVKYVCFVFVFVDRKGLDNRRKKITVNINERKKPLNDQMGKKLQTIKQKADYVCVLHI